MKEFDVVSLPRCPHHEGDLKLNFVLVKWQFTLIQVNTGVPMKCCFVLFSERGALGLNNSVEEVPVVTHYVTADCFPE